MVCMQTTKTSNGDESPSSYRQHKMNCNIFLLISKNNSFNLVSDVNSIVSGKYFGEKKISPTLTRLRGTHKL